MERAHGVVFAMVLVACAPLSQPVASVTLVAPAAMALRAPAPTTVPPVVLQRFESGWVRDRAMACAGPHHGVGRIVLALSRLDGMLHAKVDHVRDVPAPVVNCLVAAFTNVQIGPFLSDQELANVPWPDETILHVPLTFAAAGNGRW